MNRISFVSSAGATRREFLRSAAAGGLALAATSWPAAGAVAEPGYSIGCYTRPWDAFELRVALDGIAEAGFTRAGIMTAKGKSWVVITVDSTPEEAASVEAEARQRGLKIVSIYGGDFPAATSVEAGISGLKRLIDHCATCGCPNLMLGGASDPKVSGAYYQVVRECCDYAVSKGVGLSVKPHGGENATGSQCRQILERVGHRNFRLWYDPGNIFYYSDGKLDPADDCAAVDGLVAGMSVKDFLPPKEVYVTPGAGKVDFPRVLGRLRQGGFTQGPLVIECLARHEDPKRVTAEARTARAFVEQVARSVRSDGGRKQ